MGPYFIFLALVIEAAMTRRLKEQGSSISYQEAMADLEELRDIRSEARG